MKRILVVFLTLLLLVPNAVFAITTKDGYTFKEVPRIPLEEDIPIISWKDGVPMYNGKQFTVGIAIDGDQNNVYGDIVYFVNGKPVCGWQTYEEVVEDLNPITDDNKSHISIKPSLSAGFDKNIVMELDKVDENDEGLFSYLLYITAVNGYSPSFTLPSGRYKVIDVYVEGDNLEDYMFDFTEESQTITPNAAGLITIKQITDEELVDGDDTDAKKDIDKQISEIKGKKSDNEEGKVKVIKKSDKEKEEVKKAEFKEVKRGGNKKISMILLILIAVTGIAYIIVKKKKDEK